MVGHCAATGAQLGDVVALIVRYPDVSAVEHNAIGSVADWKRSKVLAVAGPELGDSAVERVYDPDAGAIKGDSFGGICRR